MNADTLNHFGMSGVSLVLVEDFDSIRHYGVKGMSWGVRRAIRDRATSAAVERRTAEKYEKKKNRLERKISNQEARGWRSTNVVRRKEKARRKMEAARSMERKFSKGLSKADIAKGQRQVKRERVASVLAGGIVMRTAVENSRYERALRRGL